MSRFWSSPRRRIRFEDVTAKAGIDVGDASWGTYGAAWGDFDNDGLIDLLICRHALAPALYRNIGRGRFTDVTEQSGLTVNITAERLFLLDRHGCAWGDFDGDGRLDLYCSMGAEDGQGETSNQLFRNIGDGRFEEIAASQGLQDARGRGRGVYWVDYDRDGQLELFVANTRRAGVPSRLFRRTDTGFLDVAAQAGVEIEEDLLGAGALWFDIDGDGWVDLLVAGYDGILLFHNNHDGTFARVPGADIGLTTSAVRSISHGDVNNDGCADVFVCNIGGPAQLFRNRGDGTFEDVSDRAGISVSRCAAAVWADFDNDGWQDIFVVREYDPHIGMNMPNSLFMNNGDGTFTDVALEAGVADVLPGSGDSAAVADYDNDGFLDIIVTDASCQVEMPEGPVYAPLTGEGFPPGRIIQYASRRNPVTLYRNRGNANRWITLRLVGQSPNSGAYGTRVRLTAGQRTQWCTIGDGMVQYGQSDRAAHFGLSDARVVDEIEVRWPSGHEQIIRNVESNQFLSLLEPEPR